MPATDKPLDTIWEVSDELWQQVEPILLEDAPPKQTGRKRAPWRPILNGIIFRLRSGCQWNRLPKPLFGDDSTVHRWFQRWVRRGVFRRLWAVLVEACDELGDVHWDWQSADGRLGKARFGGKKGGQKSHRSRQSRQQTIPAGRG
jgi:putative transposase